LLDSVPQIFTIEVWSCPEFGALLVTHELLHLA